MRNIIILSRHASTLQIFNNELDRIERSVGYRPEDWLAEEYHNIIDDCMMDEYFDLDRFKLSFSSMVDDFIDFVNNHYQYLQMDI